MSEIMDYVETLADVCGVADLYKDKEILIDIYGEDICKYQYAIVIGHKMIEKIIEKIPLSYEDDIIAKKYLDEYYNSHKRAAKLAKKVADKIKEKGNHAIVLDVGGDTDEINLKIPFSNKASAHISGVGWIGKNDLLITPEFGPRLTWVTILTDEPLAKYVKDEMNSLCDDCVLCVNACPAGAIKDLSDPKLSYDSHKCGEYIMKHHNEGHPLVCGMCLYICPYGNKKTAKITGEDRRR